MAVFLGTKSVDYLTDSTLDYLNSCCGHFFRFIILDNSSQRIVDSALPWPSSNQSSKLPFDQSDKIGGATMHSGSNALP